MKRKVLQPSQFPFKFNETWQNKSLDIVHQGYQVSRSYLTNCEKYGGEMKSGMAKTWINRVQSDFLRDFLSEKQT